MHHPYSPDLAPSVYYLFPSMTNDCTDERFASREACENPAQFAANSERGFCESGTTKLSSK